MSEKLKKIYKDFINNHLTNKIILYKVVHNKVLCEIQK